MREQRGHDEVGGRAFARRGINVCVWPHSVFAGGPTGLALHTVFRLLLGGYEEDHWTQDGPEKTEERKQTHGWTRRYRSGQKSREWPQPRGLRQDTQRMKDKSSETGCGSLKMVASETELHQSHQDPEAIL